MVDNANDSIQEVIDLQDQNESEIESQFLQNESVDEYCKKVMGIIRTCQKCSSEIQGWHHYSDFSGVQFTMTRISKLLHGLISKIFSHQDIKLNINGFKLVDQFDIIREGNDALLEKISSDVDEALGIRRNVDIEIVDSTVRTIRGPINQDSGREMVLLAPRNVQKPQLFFSPKIDNSGKEPFIPLIKEKPNSIKPLSILICLTPDGKEYYSHPYDYELQHWSPPNKFLVKKDPILPIPILQTPFQLVDSEQSLQQMVEELRGVTEIAVDLENHSFRTYQGLTCLIQISTRAKDYIVDPFPTRNHLPILNEVFTNPKITKVFHGADHDILWLQRDCGVYVVNMFDTHQAAIVLEYPHRSLANLLFQFCEITADKTYQRADWRVRPLPEDFVSYARQDSHFLLYVYDIMRNELIEKGNEFNNLLQATYSRSTELCLKRYEKPIVGPDSFLDLYRRSRKQFDKRQLYTLQQIYLWRDRIARQQDESVDFVLPKHMMLAIADIRPKEIQGIIACCNPIPPLVKTEQLTLHQIIRSTRDIKEEQLQINQDLDQTWGCNALNEMSDARDIHATLVCKHDLFLMEEDPAGLSTLLNPQETLFGDLFSQNAVNTESINDSSLFGLQKEDLWCKRINLNATTTEFMSPYERYKILIENQSTEEPENIPPEPAPVGDEARIQNIRSYFLSLSQTSTSPTTPTTENIEQPESDQERIMRLQSQISKVAADSSGKPPPQKKSKFSKKKKKQEQLKRRSSEAGMDDEASKRVKAETAEVKEEINDIEEFDYSQANYNIFHSKKLPKRKRKIRGSSRGKIRGSFRGKGPKKQPDFKKTGMKSVTWGTAQN